MPATRILAALMLFAAPAAFAADPVPADRFDLSEWNITLPQDDDGDGKADSVSVEDIQTYSHPDFFHLDSQGRMVFTAPNKAVTTKNSSNTRSELRHMLRGTNTRHKTHGPMNNFAVEARKGSDRFARVGGRLSATLHVDHVAARAGEKTARSAHSVVVGQIHAVKMKDTRSGFGYGNEPIKIFYKKFPDHDFGSLFWTYERNLPKDDKNRTDIAYPVFGNDWADKSEPGEAGIRLGEEFSYTINVHRNMMYLTFSSPRHGTKQFTKSLVTQHDAYGEIDELDNLHSYGGDALFFKAGAYNQCSTKTGGGLWYAGCPGSGDWAVDEANGDFARVTFSRLEVGEATAP